MTIQFSLTQESPDTVDTACMVVGAFEDRVLSDAAKRVDEKSASAITRLIESSDINGKLGTSNLLFALPNIKAHRVLVIGLGDQKKLDAARFSRACADAARVLKGLPLKNAISYLTDIDVAGKDVAWKVRAAAVATDAQAYKYTATFKPREKPKTPEFDSITFAAADSAKSALAAATAIANGVRFARELGNLPPNICNPQHIADE